MKLSDRAMLVNLKIKVWTATREDKARSGEIATKYQSDPRMGKYRKHLIDPSALKAITKLEGEMRNRHYELTLPWGDDSGRIIATAGFFGYRDEMTAYQEQLTPMFDQFAGDYPSLIQNARCLLNGLWDESEYPKPDRIRRFFACGVKFRPVPEADDFRVQLGDAEVKAIRQQITDEAQTLMADSVAEVARRIRDVVGRMAERLTAYQVSESDGVSSPFRNSLVENVSDLIACMPGLNIAGDSRIDSLVADMRGSLTGYTPDKLRSDAIARAQVAASAAGILDRLSAYGL